MRRPHFGTRLGISWRNPVMISKKLFISLLILFAILVFPISIISFNHIGEDAFITFRYIENFVDGKGLVFNEGERVEGYSNFLWLLILTAPKLLGLTLINSSKVLSIFFHALLILISPLFFVDLKEKKLPLFALLPALLLLLNPMLHYQSDRGLETLLYCFLMTLSALCYIKHRYYGASLAFALLAMTRPEGFAYYLIVFAAFAIEKKLYDIEGLRKQQKTDLLRFVLPFIVIFGTYIIWREHYYGHPLPNTVYAKFSHLNFLRNPSLGDLWQFVLSFSFLPILPFGILFFLKRLEHRQRREVIILFIFVLAVVGYTIYIGKVSAAGFRHYVPMIPFVVILVCKMLAIISGDSFSRYGKIVISLSLAFFVMNIYTVNNLDSKRTRFHLRLWQFVENPDFGERLEWFMEPPVFFYSEAGKWIRDELPRNALLACDQMGQVGYYAPQKIIDLLGLMDEQIAHNGLSIDYLVERNPDYILIFGAYGDIYIHHLKNLSDDPRFREHYTLLYRLQSKAEFDSSEFFVYGNRDTISLDKFENADVPIIKQLGLTDEEFDKRWRCL